MLFFSATMHLLTLKSVKSLNTVNDTDVCMDTKCTTNSGQHGTKAQFVFCNYLEIHRKSLQHLTSLSKRWMGAGGWLHLENISGKEECQGDGKMHGGQWRGRERAAGSDEIRATIERGVCGHISSADMDSEPWRLFQRNMVREDARCDVAGTCTMRLIILNIFSLNFRNVTFLFEL